MSTQGRKFAQIHKKICRFQKKIFQVIKKFYLVQINCKYEKNINNKTHRPYYFKEKYKIS